MSGLTTPGKLPYPTGTDLVRDGDDSMKALAEAAQNAILIAVRASNDAIAASTWGTMAATIATMPSGVYWCQATCLWYPEIGEGLVGYTWLNASVSGMQVGVNTGYVGVKSGGNPNSTVLSGIVNFNGGTMNLNTQFGFATNSVMACAGSNLAAIRLGPL